RDCSDGKSLGSAIELLLTVFMGNECHVFRAVEELDNVVDEIRSAVSAGIPQGLSGICGFDGFIDTFIELENPDSMEAFGPKVAEASGIATSFTARHQGDRFGGNGPLFASALHSFFDSGVDITYMGAMGDPEILPVFREALESSMKRMVSLADPAHSDCLEFRDGKVMLSDLRSCAEIHWDRLLERISREDLDEELRRCRFVGAVNWGKLVNVGTIWKGIAEGITSQGRQPKEVPFFMDLAEFEQRPLADQKELVQLVSTISKECDTILSFNLKEAWQMAEVFGGSFKGEKAPEKIAELAGYLFEQIDVDRIVIHPNDGAACASSSGAVYVPGPFCQKPLISTGAGDTFGAGVMAARLMGLSDAAMVVCGACASGYYVRTGKFPTVGQILDLAQQWKKGSLPERL
ncbi:MAG: PfkB family carbohydrate kinase, partial [Puniceicoccales bacterium]